MGLLIYVEEKSERLSYTFDFILGELLGLAYNFTTQKDIFSAHTGPKFSYHTGRLNNELFFERAPLLFETTIELQPIDFIEYENVVGFYPVSERADLPFDMFASTFVMITGYNEYLLHKKDKYDRYRASQSMNYTAGFLNKPMINYYSLLLKKVLSAKFAALSFKENKFEYIATCDVDMAFSYRGKGFNTNAAGFARSMITSKFKDVKERYQVLFGRRKDPFDSFDDILATCKNYGVKSKFFFLIGNKSALDKNISHTYEPFKDLIRKVADQSDVGVHLSFMSHISNDVMEEEKSRLEYITGKKVTANRFNYLRFTLPASYVSLSRIGITDDYSYGYATRIGFRAATCSPFYFFNLLKNERTHVKIHPFAFMDTTLVHYYKLSPRDSLSKILQLMKWVKEVEGPFVGLWHNSSFIDTGVWKGWKNVFEIVAKEAQALTEKSE